MVYGQPKDQKDIAVVYTAKKMQLDNLIQPTILGFDL